MFKGPDNAKVTLIELPPIFNDPIVLSFAPVMEQLLKTYPNDLRFVYRQYPLIGTPESPFHDKAALATQASEAADRQGKFLGNA